MNPGTDVLAELNLTATQFNIIYYIYVSLSFISLFFAILVCLTYILFKNKFPSRLTLYLALCIALGHVTGLFIVVAGAHLYDNVFICVFQGVLNQFSGVSTLLWWLCMTVNHYLSLVLELKTKKYEKYMHGFCWLTSLTATLTPALAQPMRPLGLWCWINDPVWQILSYYLIMAICCCVGGILWALTLRNLQKTTQNRNKEQSVYVLRQAIFISWFFVIFVFMAVHRTYVAVKQKGYFDLELPHVIAEASQGLLVFCIFGLRIEYYHMWKDFFRDIMYKYFHCGSYEAVY